jgi:hypothetical protein
VHFPADQRHRGSIHRTALGCEKSSVGQRNLRHAEHNAIVFCRFMGNLEALLCPGSVQRCRKKRGKKNVLGDAAEASSDGDHSSGNDGDENEDKDAEEVE